MKDDSKNELLTHWAKFYTSASDLASSFPANEHADKILLTRLQITLDTLTQILFGSDSNQKAQIVTYDKGSLHLIVSLVNSSRVLDSGSGSVEEETTRNKIITSSLKAIKTCVVRNPIGRRYCRSAGVLPVLQRILNHYVTVQDSSMVEEALTTLAATCLGDDLNALQGAMEVSTLVSQAMELFPNEKSLQDKITYLTTLFDTLRKEQSSLLQSWNKSEEKDDTQASCRSFFVLIQQAEELLLSKDNIDDNQESLTSVMDDLETYQSSTKLVNSLIQELRYQRASISYQNKNLQQCCQDTNILLDTNAETNGGTVSRIQVLKLSIRALIGLERWDTAMEQMGRLKVLDPTDKDIVELEGLLQKK